MGIEVVRDSLNYFSAALLKRLLKHGIDALGNDFAFEPMIG